VATSSSSAPERRGEYEERVSCGRAIFGDFGTTLLLKKCSRPEIAKGGNLGERLQRIGATRSRGRSEREGTETESETETETESSGVASSAPVLALGVEEGRGRCRRDPAGPSCSDIVTVTLCDAS
jgi:hypothetical protein